eukprot:scaffold4827_cov109-Isochrysis_galbana.AAC.22
MPVGAIRSRESRCAARAWQCPSSRPRLSTQLSHARASRLSQLHPTKAPRRLKPPPVATTPCGLFRTRASSPPRPRP